MSIRQTPWPRQIGGGVQFNEPESCARKPPSAVAIAAGLGCSWQAASGVVAVLTTVTVTEPWAGMVPKLQLSTFPTIGFTQVPCVGVAVCQTSPPLPGSTSVSCTFVAACAPAEAVLRMTIVKLTCDPCVKVPLSGVLTTASSGGNSQFSEPESCARKPPSAVAIAAGLGCGTQAAAGVVGVLTTVTVTEPWAGMVPKLQLSTFPTIGFTQVPCVGVAVCQTSPPLPGSTSVSCTFVAACAPAGARLLTTIVKLTCDPCVKVPLSGVLTTASSGGNSQFSEPESCARKPPSAVAIAAGLGCGTQAAAGVVGVLTTVTVTEPWAGMVPKLQLSTFPTIGFTQVPCVGVAVCQTSPPLPGSTSVSCTFVAACAPAGARLLTTIVKLTCDPCVKVPLSGVLTTASSGGNSQFSEPESCARKPPSAVAIAAGLGCGTQAAAGVVGVLTTVTVTEPWAGMVPKLQLSTFPTIGFTQVPCVGVAVCQTSPPLPGSTSVSCTFVAACAPAEAVLRTTIVKLTCDPCVKVPLSGVFSTISCGGGIQFSEPESCARKPPSAVAIAAGLGCGTQAAAGVVGVLTTVTVTEPWAGMVPKLQLSAFPAIGFTQVPCVGVAVCQTSPPLPGSTSVSCTFVAACAPVGAGLLTTIVKLTCDPCVKVPLSGVFSTISCGGGIQFSEPESCARKPPSAVAIAAGLGCDTQAASGGVGVLTTVTVTEPWGGMGPQPQLSTFPPIGFTQVPCVGVAVCQTSPPLPGSTSVSCTFVAACAPAEAVLRTTIVKLTCDPCVKVPLSGVFSTISCGGGIQFSEPESCARKPPSAVAIAAGLGCGTQAAAGVVGVLTTVTVTEPWGGMGPQPQLSTFPPIGFTQVPCVGVAVCQTSPPLPGSTSVSCTFVAACAPVGAGLLTTIVKLTCDPCVKVPLSGVFSTISCGGGIQFSEPESCARKPPSAVAIAAGLGCDTQAASGGVGVLTTVTVTEPWGGMGPQPQLSTFPPIGF